MTDDFEDFNLPELPEFEDDEDMVDPELLDLAEGNNQMIKDAYEGLEKARQTVKEDFELLADALAVSEEEELTYEEIMSSDFLADGSPVLANEDSFEETHFFDF